MTVTVEHVVIVGAGHGGVAAAASLRLHGFDGTVTLLSGEECHPYDRPPLSKKLLSGKEPTALVPEGYFENQAIDFLCGVVATEIDRGAKSVSLTNGRHLDYDVLVLATGARARTLDVPGSDLPNVRRLRTLDDARALEREVRPGDSFAIIGGGWIGLEVASSARSRDHPVTVIEREDRLLSRIASPQLADFITGVHVDRGVRVLTGSDVVAFDTDGMGAASGVVLDNGVVVSSDHIVVAVGAVPNDELAAAAGVRCDSGVLVDDLGRTDDPWIYAIGDVTRRPVAGSEGLVRLESIPSALEQARRAASAIVGAPIPDPEVSWFWSDQLGMKIQIGGNSAGAKTVHVEGDRESVAIFHVSDGTLLCVEAVNSTAAFKKGTALIRSGEPLDATAYSATAVTAEAPAVSESGASARDENTLEAVFIQPDGGQRRVGIPLGSSLMEGAVKAKVAGILAECGGGCACGTCHVYVDDAMIERLEAPAQIEVDMLEFVDGVQANSRLSCQLMMTADLHGIVVRVADVRV